MRRAHDMLHAIRREAGQIIESDVEVLKSTIVGEDRLEELEKGLPRPAKAYNLTPRMPRPAPCQFDAMRMKFQMPRGEG